MGAKNYAVRDDLASMEIGVPLGRTSLRSDVVLMPGSVEASQESHRLDAEITPRGTRGAIATDLLRVSPD